MRSKLKKSAFGPVPGVWVNSEYLPPAVRAELHNLVLKKGKGSEAQARALVTAACEYAQFRADVGIPAAPDVIRAGLSSVADRAHDLLHALNSLPPGATSAFHAYQDMLAFLTDYPRRPSAISTGLRSREDGFLGAAWDLVHDLRDAADYAADHVKPDRGHRPAQAVARGLVRDLAWAYRANFGTTPKTHKTAWFPEFCAKVGESIPQRLKIGPALVAGVVSEMASTPDT